MRKVKKQHETTDKQRKYRLKDRKRASFIKGPQKNCDFCKIIAKKMRFCLDNLKKTRDFRQRIVKKMQFSPKSSEKKCNIRRWMMKDDEN